MSQSPCPGQHTAYQPTDEEWACPHCGAGPEYFYVDFTNYSDCDLLHTDDVIVCCSKACIDKNGECREWSGKALAAALQKKANMVKCPCCNGRGYVTKDTYAAYLSHSCKPKRSGV